MITLAARAALASNAQVIEVLRLIGARDVYVVRAFTRRITIRAIGGALIGAIIATLLVAALPPADQGTGLLAQFGFRGVQWLWPFTLPAVAGIVAFLASRAAAFATLRKTT